MIYVYIDIYVFGRIRQHRSERIFHPPFLQTSYPKSLSLEESTFAHWHALPVIRQSTFDTHPGKYFTLPFLQTSYPYRCRSTNQRSRIGMRFPSSASTHAGGFFTLPSSRPPTLNRCRSRNQRHRIGMRFPSSADPLAGAWRVLNF